MSLVWVVIGTIFQLCLAGFLFMLVMFSAGGIESTNTLTKVQSWIFTVSVYLLPALCLISAWLVIHSYRSGGGSDAYWWYAMPIVGAVTYGIYALSYE